MGSARRKTVRREAFSGDSGVNQFSLIPEESQRLETPVVVLTLPLRNGREWPVTQAFINKLEPCYPHVDVPQTFREMRGWLLINTEKRKTTRGIRRFISNWLASEQAKHGRQA